MSFILLDHHAEWFLQDGIMQAKNQLYFMLQFPCPSSFRKIIPRNVPFGTLATCVLSSMIRKIQVLSASLEVIFQQKEH